MTPGAARYGAGKRVGEALLMDTGGVPPAEGPKSRGGLGIPGPDTVV